MLLTFINFYNSLYIFSYFLQYPQVFFRQRLWGSAFLAFVWKDVSIKYAKNGLKHSIGGVSYVHDYSGIAAVIFYNNKNEPTSNCRG